MFCTACGNTLNEGDRYCAQCGKANSPGPGEANSTAAQPRIIPRAAWPLWRSMSERKIAGVCSGIARYLDWDVTLVRVGFLMLIFLHGAGLIGYIILWIAMPRDDRQPARVEGPAIV